MSLEHISIRSVPHHIFSAVTQAAIRRQLAEEDAAALKAGTANNVHKKCSVSGMLIAGIELEDAQYVFSLH